MSSTATLLRLGPSAPPPPAAPAPPAPPDRERLARQAVLLGAVLIGYALARGRGDGEIGPWGIIEVLPPTYLGCLAVPAVIFLDELYRRRRTAVLLPALLAQTVLVYGSVAFAESMARFPTAWLHAGFVTEILRTGELARGVDARYSWPGFFTAAGAFAATAGVDPAGLLRWAPLCFAVANLLPLALLFRALHPSKRVRWLGLWVFVAANWVGQDYFAPQAFGFLLHLSVLAVVATAFRRGTAGRYAPRQQAALIVVIVAAATAVAMSHQLTPFMLAATLLPPALLGRIRIRLLPLVLATISVAWVCYGAQDFWSGHLHEILGLGDSGSPVAAGVGGRVVGSPQHQAVVNVRIGLAGTVWLLAGAGAAHALLRRRAGLFTLLIAATPLLTVAGQSYGGEGVLRGYLFSLPAAALLAAEALVAATGAGRRVVAYAGVALTLAALPLTLVARYGNESYEHVTPGEAKAIAALYDLAPPGSTLICLTQSISWRQNGPTRYDYPAPVLSESGPASAHDLIRVLSQNPRGGYVVVSDSQVAYGREVQSLPPDWGAGFERDLLGSGRFAVALGNADATVYRFLPATAAAVR